MHGVLLGVTKSLLIIWFDPAEHREFYKANKTYPDYFIGHEVSFSNSLDDSFIIFLA